MGRPWTLRLSRTAEADFRGILRWTRDNWGDRQARLYADTLAGALTALTAGPSQPGVTRRDEIGEGLMTLHVARSGRKGRHLVLFRIDPAAPTPTIDVLRLLHDAMDIARNLPPEQS